MYNPETIIFIICAYIAILFFIAMWAERQSGASKLCNNAVLYSFSLAIYCTSWTYYGSVGKAATSGMLFLTIYLGPTLAMIFGFSVLRKLVRIKNTYRITSIADFIAARYGKSQLLAAIATIIALIGIVPYIALQLKAVISTFYIITIPSSRLTPIIKDNVGIIVVILMILFTIIFGLRRIDTTERHQGMVVAVAIQSLVKLITFIAAGIFVTYFIFNGFGDIFQSFSENKFHHFITMSQHSSIDSQFRWTDEYFTENERFAANNSPQSLLQPVSFHGIKQYLIGNNDFSTWFTYLILAMSAIFFLPRQFHIAVVENSDERHIRTAIWLLPLYMFLINIFVLPIAFSGLLKGLPLWEADNFVLILPLYYGSPWLALLVFIGGFSAATSMIMISSMTMATMMTNHLLFPLLDSVGWLGFLKRHLLKIRWAAVMAVILLGYGFEKQIGESYTLVNMGMISFAAALQFAPVILGGIFWRKGNRAGAILGLVAGFAIWFYTLLFPSFIRSGWIFANELLRQGPWGIAILRPEQLFGLGGFDSLTHAVFWSIFFNISLYVLGSLYFEQSKEEKKDAEAFVSVFTPHDILSSRSRILSFQRDIQILWSEKKKQFEKLLRQYFTQTRATDIMEKCLFKLGFHKKSKISVIELADICSEIERFLSGSIGTALAYKAFREAEIFTPEETEALSVVYGEILADLNVNPDELKQKIDYYQERDILITAHATELEGKVCELQNEIQRRERAEKKVLELIQELEQRVIARTAELQAANKELESFAYSVSHDLQAPLRSIKGFSQALLEDYTDLLDEDGKDYLRRVHDASLRMEQLIIDILKLSRTTRSKMRYETVELSQIAQEIVENLQKSEPERYVKFIIAPNLVTIGDPRLIKVALENLIGNAWKFTNKRTDAQIEFGILEGSDMIPDERDQIPNAEETDKNKEDSPVYFIRDNGAGFDMQYANKLFGAFQRLHGNDEFPGTGIGLATVHRVIQRHGGRIWATGAPNSGATFYFSL